LLLLLRQGDNVVGTATGFVVTQHDVDVLVTNVHVLRGDAADPPVPPDNVMVMHNEAGRLGSHVPTIERLYDDDGNPTWLEHPLVFGERVDVAGLRLRKIRGTDIYPHDLWKPDLGIALGVSEGVHIIGFPFGKTGGAALGLGIWVRGFIATEPRIGWNNLPCFLVDSRTRQGQSGSPVIFYQAGGGIPLAKGGVGLFGGVVEQFLGCYSGRINAESDLGIVWSKVAVQVVVSSVVEAASKPE
jgi:hypothetical protein